MSVLDITRKLCLCNNKVNKLMRQVMIIYSDFINIKWVQHLIYLPNIYKIFYIHMLLVVIKEHGRAREMSMSV